MPIPPPSFDEISAAWGVAEGCVTVSNSQESFQVVE